MKGFDDHLDNYGDPGPYEQAQQDPIMRGFNDPFEQVKVLLASAHIRTLEFCCQQHRAQRIKAMCETTTQAVTGYTFAYAQYTVNVALNVNHDDLHRLYDEYRVNGQLIATAYHAADDFLDRHVILYNFALQRAKVQYPYQEHPTCQISVYLPSKDVDNFVRQMLGTIASPSLM